MRIIASLRPRPSVRGEQPHPTSGELAVQNTADLKEYHINTVSITSFLKHIFQALQDDSEEI